MSKLEFSELDLKSISLNNFTTDSIIKQYEFIQNNQHFTEILDCCDINKGVLRLDDLSSKNTLEDNFLKIINNNNLIKFVPASGASSRMFAFLIKYYHFLVDENSEISDKELKEVEYFFENLEKFSFFNLLPQRIINDYLDFEAQNSEISTNSINSNITRSNDLNKNHTEKLISLRYSILHEILFDSNVENEISGLNYANEAKGNIKFHKLDDSNHSLNAFETHILEHIYYAIYRHLNKQSLETNKEYPKNISAKELYNMIENLIPIEFSINEDIFNHYISLEKQNIKYEIYNNLSTIIKLLYSNEIDIKTLSKIIDSKVFYSKQDKSSNSVAFDENLNLVRKENGEFVTRAGGHGALIFNLQDINQEYIFIKNIDNVTKTSLHQEIFENTINLVGFTKFIKDKVDIYLAYLFEISSINKIEFNEVEKSKIQEIANFVKSYLLEDFNIEVFNLEVFNKDIKSELDELTRILINILDRPLRVVAVVKNTGEPGGGPFYIDLNDNNKQNFEIFSKISTKQIIELSQIDMTNENQANIVKTSKYFNPVFMVLNYTRFDNSKYNLSNYMSDNMAMVVEKNYGAKIIKSYEYPGLWNGAMAYWNTVFLELPNVIFHPVKTVNDLLKEGHLD